MDIQRAFISAADKVFVLVDSSKFNMNSLYSVSPLSKNFTLVTDNELCEDILESYKKNGIRIIK